MSSARRRSPIDPERLKGNMRMDRNPKTMRISDPSHPAGKRKEIDNVMKKARQAPPNEYWDKKLLEAEEKDPGRWKHSGYKKMYVNGVRRSRSPMQNMRKTPPRHIPQSPVRRRPVEMPVRTPERYRPKSPPMRYARKSPPLPRNEMKSKEIPYRPKRPMSPPPPKARTPSISSCSDSSQCSGCSSDEDRRVVDKRHRMDRHGPVNRMRVMSPDEVEHISSKKNKVKEVSPKRRHLKRPASPMIEKSRREIASPVLARKKDKARTRIKIEGEKRRRRSPSSGSDDSTSSGGTFSALTATTRITLNERFAKMAQWNNDRKYDMSNMKITKNSEGGDRSAVMIQQEQNRESPMRQFSFNSQYANKGEGHYPEELMHQSSAQAMGLAAWDDVRVRFDYYKSKGYLRDLTLQDYIKWEEWWYRYQDWLKQERYFEMIERNMMRRRRKKIPIQQRLN